MKLKYSSKYSSRSEDICVFAIVSILMLLVNAPIVLGFMFWSK